MPRHSSHTPLFEPRIIRRQHGLLVTSPGRTVPEPPPPEPTPDVLLDFIDGMGSPHGIVAVGDHLYVSDPGDGVIYVIDKSNPAALGTPAGFGSVDQVAIAAHASGTHIYVAQANLLRIYTLASPAAPSLVGSTPGSVGGSGLVFASGPRVYATGYNADRVYNVSVTTPASPTISSTVTNAVLDGAAGVDFQGSHVYVAAELAGRLVSVNIATPGAIAVAHSITHADLVGAFDVALSLSWAYVVSPTTGKLVVVDKSTPTALSYVTSISIPAARALTIDGDYIFVVTDDQLGASNLVVVDIADPIDPQIINTVTGVLGSGRDVTVDDDVVYVTDTSATGTVWSFDAAALIAGGVVGGDPTPPPLTGWRPLMLEDFDTDVALGAATTSGSSTSMAAYPNIGVYPTSYYDTSDKFGRPQATRGQYDANATVSVSGGVLTKHLHSVGTRPKVCALLPRLPASDPAVIATGLWTYQLYGRYEIVARFPDVMPGYKCAWLTWPMDGGNALNGELDFPETDFDALTSVGAFVHHAPSTPAPHQHGDGSISVDMTAWHTYTIEWTPGFVEFFLDGVSVFDDNDRIPAAPMRWVIQTETHLDAAPPGTGVAGDVEIDSVAVWAYDP